MHTLLFAVVPPSYFVSLRRRLYLHNTNRRKNKGDVRRGVGVEDDVRKGVEDDVRKGVGVEDDVRRGVGVEDVCMKGSGS
jgi:hypothetical protein